MSPRNKFEEKKETKTKSQKYGGQDYVKHTRPLSIFIVTIIIIIIGVGFIFYAFVFTYNTVNDPLLK